MITSIVLKNNGEVCPETENRKFNRSNCIKVEGKTRQFLSVLSQINWLGVS